MNFKRRGNRISLYRSTWVPKGPDTPHGYTRQTFIGSIPADATATPPELDELLTHGERYTLERRIIAPANAQQEASARQAKHREVDPLWRLDDALRLVNEAAERSQTMAVVASRTQLLKSALEKVKTVGGGAVAPQDSPQTEPLLEVLKAIAEATDAVRKGRYGRGPQSGFRKTSVFRQWTEILAAVDGGERSLLRALQAAGFATRRKH